MHVWTLSVAFASRYRSSPLNPFARQVGLRYLQSSMQAQQAAMAEAAATVGRGPGRVVDPEREAPSLLVTYGMKRMSGGAKRRCDRRRLHHRSPTSYQIHEHNIMRCLYF
jgi:hypothetical protein